MHHPRGIGPLYGQGFETAEQAFTSALQNSFLPGPQLTKAVRKEAQVLAREQPLLFGAGEVSFCDPFAISVVRLQFEIYPDTDPSIQCDERICPSVGNIELERLSHHRGLAVRESTMKALTATQPDVSCRNSEMLTENDS